MSKESLAKEVNTCPKCNGDFTFLEAHIPHCTGFKIAKSKPNKPVRRRVATG